MREDVLVAPGLGAAAVVEEVVEGAVVVAAVAVGVEIQGVQIGGGGGRRNGSW